MVTKLKHVGTVRIGSESYKLVETDDQQAWQEQFLHEPPWSEGLPPILSEPAETWHLGGLKSRQGIPGTSDYGQNTDARYPYRLLPGPKVNVVTLTGNIFNPTRIFEALGYIWVVGGRYVYRIDPSDDSVVESKDFGDGQASGIDGLKWETDTGLVTTDGSDRSLWEVSAIGTPDTWDQAAAGVKAYRLAAGIDRLFGIEGFGLLRNVVSGLSPLVANNWADRIQCGETSTLATGLLAFERTVLAGKPEGLFSVSPEGKGIPLIKRMIRDDDNCLGMHMHEPYAIVPHSRGAYRFLPGMVESMGLERELLNRSPIKGRFKAFATDNQWLLGLLKVSTHTYIMVARDRSGGEPGFGPMIWDTWAYLAGISSRAMHHSSLTTPPRLWFGHDNNVGYIKLSDAAGGPDVDGSAYRFVTSGNRSTNRYDFGDRRPKDFPKIVVQGGDNIDSGTYWEVRYSVDGGAFLANDIKGNPILANDQTLQTYYLPLNVQGRTIQFLLLYTGASDAAAGELDYLEPFAVPQSQKVPINVIQLHLAEGITQDLGQEARTAAEQLEDLRVLDETAAPLKASGPWGEDKDMWVKRLRLISVIQEEPETAPEYLVELALQERKVS